MSGLHRNIISQERIKVSGIKKLPEVIRESPSKLNSKVFAKERFDAENDSFIKNYEKFRYNSTVSSAHSQRFPHIFHTADWPSLSDTGTDSPDCIELEGSDSSGSSMFSWADAESTKQVANEWEKIQRTLYDEVGPKVTQKHLIEECNQWKSIFPHLRIVGHGYHVVNSENDESCDTEEEVLALNYDCDVHSSANQVSSAIVSGHSRAHNKLLPLRTHKIVINDRTKEHISDIKPSKTSAMSLIEKIDSFLHITPLNQNALCHLNTPHYRTSSIVKSEISSSRWRQRKGVSPDFVSLPYHSVHENFRSTRDNSAASLFSNPGKKHFNKKVLSSNWHDDEINNAHQWSSISSKRTAAEKQNNMLEPIDSSLITRNMSHRSILSSDHESIFKSSAKNARNISLPPIQSEENAGRRKQHMDDKTHSGKYYRINKKTLSPINSIPSNGSKNSHGSNDVHFPESKFDSYKGKRKKKLTKNFK